MILRIQDKLTDVVGTFNVFVKDDGDRSRVRFTTTGKGSFQQFNVYGQPVGNATIKECNSTGELEKLFYSEFK